MSTLEETILKENTYSNVKLWNDNGFTGKDIVVWTTEGAGNHSEIVTRRIKDSALECIVISSGLSMSASRDKVNYSYTNYNNEKINTEDFIKRFNINIITRSIGGGLATGGAESKFWNSLKFKYNLSLYNSAGNDGRELNGGSLPPDVATYIAACTLKNGIPTREAYSSVGEEVDFCNFVGIWSGTSFAAPYTAGEDALIRQRYGNMSGEEVFKYMIMISQDMDIKGIDNKTGHGIPILPELGRKYITMSTTSNQYCVDGNIKTMDTKPVNLNGNVFVPIRAISESLGADVKWEPISRTVLINDIISLQIGNKEAFVGDKKVTLNYAPFIDKNNRTLVPIRFIAEALNCKVDWVQNESKVMILEK